MRDPILKETLRLNPGGMPAGSSEARGHRETCPAARPTPAHCPLPPAEPRSVLGGAGGPCLLCNVEGAAVGLRVGPAAAEGLPQDGVVRLLDPLQAMNGEPWVRDGAGCMWTEDGLGGCPLPTALGTAGRRSLEGTAWCAASVGEWHPTSALGRPYFACGLYILGGSLRCLVCI